MTDHSKTKSLEIQTSKTLVPNVFGTPILGIQSATVQCKSDYLTHKAWINLNTRYFCVRLLNGRGNKMMLKHLKTFSLEFGCFQNSNKLGAEMSGFQTL